MKKYLLILLLLLPLTASAARPAKRVSQAELSSIVSEFRHADGVEVVKLGRLATALVRGAAAHIDDEDGEVRELRRALRGIKGVTVMEYGGAAPDVRERLSRRLSRVLDKREVLMEVKDDGEKVQIFGLLDDASGLVQDIIFFAPHECTLACLFGTLPLDFVGKIAAQ
jgi:hypothetical protein